MNRANSKIGLQIGVLIAFSAFMAFFWMLPVLLAGFPFLLSGNVLDAKEFAQTGLVGGLSPMVTVIMRMLSSVVGWQNAVGWSFVSAIALALSLIPLWWSVQKLFDTRVAWLTTTVFSFMPIQWIQAVRAGGYPFAFLFLFLGFAFFLHFYGRRRTLALFLSALFFGFALASHHAFITFLPWIVVVYIWHHRSQWKVAGVHAAMFCAVAYIGLMLPLLPNSLQQGMTLSERVAVFLPATGDHTTGVGHLYPDYYAYEFLREEFDRRILERTADAHFLTRQQDKYVHWIFGVGELTAADGIQNGLWLFMHTLPELLVQEYLGGAFLWIFILAGGLLLYKKNRYLLWYLISLWLSMECILRFVLHYGRTHLMDIGWGFALLIGIGVASLCDSFASSQKTTRATTCCTIVAIIIALQLTQANRKLFAHHYSRTTVPESYNALEVLRTLPEGAVVAHPRKAHLFYFSDVSHTVLHTETLDYLSEHGNIRDPFEHYGVTHIIGYDEKRAQMITQVLPSIQVLSVSEEGISVPITPFTRYILHLIR